jgi:hypothetical protein
MEPSQRMQETPFMVKVAVEVSASIVWMFSMALTRYFPCGGGFSGVQLLIVPKNKADTRTNKGANNLIKPPIELLIIWW